MYFTYFHNIYILSYGGVTWKKVILLAAQLPCRYWPAHYKLSSTFSDVGGVIDSKCCNSQFGRVKLVSCRVDIKL